MHTLTSKRVVKFSRDFGFEGTEYENLSDTSQQTIYSSTCATT
jgi:hypothetical protein